MTVKLIPKKQQGGSLAEDQGPQGQYYRQIIKFASDNPGALWRDDANSAAARQWLRKNAPAEFKFLYYNEPDNIRKGIDRRFLPDGVEAEQFQQGIRDATNKAAPYVAGALGAAFALPAAIEGAVAAPAVAGKAATWLANPTNAMNVGKVATSMLAGQLVDKGTQQLTPYSSWGDMVYEGTGLGNALRERGASNLVQGVAKMASEFTNPGYYTGGAFERAAKGMASAKAPRVVARTTPALAEASEGEAAVPEKRVITKEDAERFKVNVSRGYYNARDYIQSPERAEFEHELDELAKAQGYIKPEESLAFSSYRQDAAPFKFVPKFEGRPGVAGEYIPREHRVNIRLDATEKDVPMHEYLHSFRFGNTPRLNLNYSLPDDIAEKVLEHDAFAKRYRTLESEYGPELFEIRSRIQKSRFNLAQARQARKRSPGISSEEAELKAYRELQNTLNSANENPIWQELTKAKNGIDATDATINPYKDLLARSERFRADRVRPLVDKQAIAEAYPNDSKKVEEVYEYLTLPHETVTHGLSTGVTVGVKPFSKYPGNEAFDNFYNEAAKVNSNFRFFRHSTPDEKQYLWKAMSGTLLGGGAVTAGASLLPRQQTAPNTMRQGGKFNIINYIGAKHI